MNRFKPLVITLALFGSVSAFAYESGDILLRAGVTHVAPNDSSGKVKLNGSVLSLSGGDSELTVDDDTQLGLTASYVFNRNWAIELLAATPFKHTAKGTGELAGLNIADMKHLPPTLSAVYYFDSEKAFKPYIGVGVNYTVFFDEELTSEADSTLTGLGLSGGNVELDDSWGVALQAGLDYQINDRWSFSASVRWLDIDTTAEITFDNGDRITSDVEINPWVYTVSMAYQF